MAAPTCFFVALFYIRSERTSKCDGILKGLRSHVQGSVLLCGDVNAHHPVWGPAHTSKRGRQIATGAKRGGAAIAHTGIATFPKPPGITSAIDATPNSPELPITWRSDSDTQRSYHFSLHIGFRYVVCENIIQETVICCDRFRAALLLGTETP